MTAPPERKAATVGHYDAKRAAGYDHMIRQIIPAYDAVHRMVRPLLDAALGDTAQVLVVGCGTGVEIEHLAQAHPGWRFTGVDPSPDMLAVARRRLADGGLDDRVRLVEGAVGDLAGDETFDAATLILVMHFVPDEDGPGGKQALLDGIATRLATGGPLVLVDGHSGNDAERFERMLAAWRAWQVNEGIEADEVEKGFKKIIDNIHFVPEARLSALLVEAGFVEPIPFFAALVFGGWITRKG